MRLLVTRPEPDASDTAAALGTLGHVADVAPMMRIALLPEPPGRAEPAAIVLTSRNAARALADWPASARWRTRPVYAVGGATAALARVSGFGDVRVGPEGVAGLADLVRAELDPAAGVVLYPAGQDRSADLPALLTGFDVRTVEAYRAIAATRLPESITAAIGTGAFDGVLFYSRRTAAIFAGLVGAAGIGAGLRRAVLFALSPAVAEPLVSLQPATVKVAERPNEASMLALIPTAGRAGRPAK